MKSLNVYYDAERNLKTEIKDIPIPDIGPHEILIKVEAAGSNPKDWKHPLPEYFDNRLNQGDDCAGCVKPPFSM
jgi:NADPH:quinone reductase